MTLPSSTAKTLVFMIFPPFLRFAGSPGLIPVALFADLIDRLGDPGIAGERGETPGFVT
jgi:hypothetical protein